MIRVLDRALARAPCVSPRLGFRKRDDCPDLAACSLREALEAHSRADGAAPGAAEVLRSAG
ncbi:MAG TPA: hypothetical protein VHN73_05690 [Phenylobacterium sp.]|nr:hypothetical protein [Phenylobacterium sp.]